jgi:hypothetical protein
MHTRRIGLARHRAASVLIAATGLACADNLSDPAQAPSSTGLGTSGVGNSGSAGSDTGTAAGGGSADTEQVDSGASDGSSSGGFKFDVPSDPAECQGAPAGVHCNDGQAIACDGVGNVVSSTSCTPDVCLPGTGCVECLDGQFHCQGPRVMSCDTTVDPPRWTEIEICDPAAGQGCDQGLGVCTDLQPIGDIVPTGEYYQYAEFFADSNPFAGGFDVDSFGDLLYVTRLGIAAASSVDVYTVAGVDSDGDGAFEPNQHPDNPDNTGPVEQRVLAFVESIPGVSLSVSASELLVLEDRMYVGGPSITEYIFGGASSLVTTAPGWTWSGGFAQIGYDDVSGVWYGANEYDRRVFQYDAETDAWGLAFRYPPFAGGHMDGLEVVTDPNTGTPYVYVSDMTSDFIGQYRLDDELGWVQENLFAYAGTGGAVEGMGFGAFNHFWATSGTSLYEIGGGALTPYIEPPPAG